MVSLARAYLGTKKYQAAEELLEASIVIDSQNATAYQYLGFVQLRLKKPEMAVISYKNAVEIDGQDHMAYKGLGVVYILLAPNSDDGQKYKQMGIAQWEKSLEINPDQPRLKELLSKYKNN
jgi:tetratricopeptide (TPR) repeat protein